MAGVGVRDIVGEVRDQDAAVPVRPGIGRWQVVRRFLDGRWRRFHGTSVLIALPGVVFQFAGAGSQITEHSRMWRDFGLLFLVGAATVPLWRKIERDFSGQLLWRQALRKLIWRTCAVLMYATIAGLVAYRWLMQHADPSAAATVAHLADVSLALVIVLPALEPLLWRCLPFGLRYPGSLVRLNGKTGLVGSGGPIPVQKYPGGKPRELRAGSRTKQFTRFSRLISWDGRCLVVTDPRRKRTRSLPVSGRRAVAEIVLVQALSPQILGSLLFLNGRGYCVLMVDPFRFTPRVVDQLATVSGLPLSTCSVDTLAGNFAEVRDRMFPRSPRCRTVHG